MHAPRSPSPLNKEEKHRTKWARTKKNAKNARNAGRPCDFLLQILVVKGSNRKKFSKGRGQEKAKEGLIPSHGDLFTGQKSAVEKWENKKKQGKNFLRWKESRDLSLFRG